MKIDTKIFWAYFRVRKKIIYNVLNKLMNKSHFLVIHND